MKTITPISVTVSRRTLAPASEIWKLWVDVEGSPAWDADVSWSRLRGPFAVGSEGEFKLKAGLRARFVLDQVEPQRAYANTLQAPGLRIRFTHRIDPVGLKTLRVTHGAEFSGPLGRVLGRIARAPLSAALDKALAAMLALAESATGVPALADAELIARSAPSAAKRAASAS